MRFLKNAGSGFSSPSSKLPTSRAEVPDITYLEDTFALISQGVLGVLDNLTNLEDKK
jgi:hypothetical protein